MQGKIAKSNNFLLVVNDIFSTERNVQPWTLFMLPISRWNGTRLDRDVSVSRGLSRGLFTSIKHYLEFRRCRTRGIIGIKKSMRLLFSCGIKYITLLYLDRSRCSATNIIYIIVLCLNSGIVELCCQTMKLCLMKGEEKIKDVCMCEDRCMCANEHLIGLMASLFRIAFYFLLVGWVGLIKGSDLICLISRWQQV